MFDLEHIIEQLEDEGHQGITPVIVDYDWEDGDINPKGAAKITIWLMREDFND